tara:strand:- start:97 stop:255 length:159 start_codon:yes stop_codon:yes gene_type:complete
VAVVGLKIGMRVLVLKNMNVGILVIGSLITHVIPPNLDVPTLKPATMMKQLQ